MVANSSSSQHQMLSSLNNNTTTNNKEESICCAVCLEEEDTHDANADGFLSHSSRFGMLPVSKDSTIHLEGVHWIHESCLMQWLAEHDTCPVCRERIISDDDLVVIKKPPFDGFILASSFHWESFSSLSPPQQQEVFILSAAADPFPWPHTATTEFDRAQRDAGEVMRLMSERHFRVFTEATRQIEQNNNHQQRRLESIPEYSESVRFVEFWRGYWLDQYGHINWYCARRPRTFRRSFRQLVRNVVVPFLSNVRTKIVSPILNQDDQAFVDALQRYVSQWGEKESRTRVRVREEENDSI